MTDYPENFADYPQSLNDIKSNRSRNCADWTPRDALIDVLRIIDSLGENTVCENLVIVYRLKHEDGHSTKFSQAGSDGATNIGIMEVAKNRMLNQ